MALLAAPAGAGAALRVALRRAAPALLDRPPGRELEGFQWLQSPRGRFWADAFLRCSAGRDWLFVEDCYYAKGYAGLSVVELNQNGELMGGATPIMGPPYHLSYPHIVSEGGEYFMIPESSAAGTVDLWPPAVFLSSGAGNARC